MSNTVIGYAANCRVRTARGYAAMRMSGTDLGYAATRLPMLTISMKKGTGVVSAFAYPYAPTYLGTNVCVSAPVSSYRTHSLVVLTWCDCIVLRGMTLAARYLRACVCVQWYCRRSCSSTDVCVSATVCSYQVTSVPSDAPDDWIALMVQKSLRSPASTDSVYDGTDSAHGTDLGMTPQDLKKKAPLREKYGVKDEWVLPFEKSGMAYGSVRWQWSVLCCGPSGMVYCVVLWKAYAMRRYQFRCDLGYCATHIPGITEALPSTTSLVPSRSFTSSSFRTNYQFGTVQ
eukprot:2008393-Rhodomonas_salina.1